MAVNATSEESSSAEKRKRDDYEAEISQLKIRINNNDLTIKEHLYFLKRDAVKENSFSTITLLNGLYKKLQEQHGIFDRDDLFRGGNILKRQKINE